LESAKHFFENIRVADAVDALIVGYLLYLLYKLLKGSVGYNIFIGLILLSVIYLAVETFQLRMLSMILGSVFQLGAIILIIVFQPEIRRFLLMIGNNTLKGRNQFLSRFFGKEISAVDKQYSSMAKTIKNALVKLSRRKAGALVVLMQDMNEEILSGSGVKVDAKISELLIENIFENKAPLHDGAMIISGDRIHSASVILPVSKNTDVDPNLGLRHRAALGISEATTAVAYIVSEENGKISYAHKGKLFIDIPVQDLETLIKTHLTIKQ